MKVNIDHDLCVGHARCYLLEPDYITADDRGRGVLRSDAPEMPAAIARKLVRACPEFAITIKRD